MNKFEKVFTNLRDVMMNYGSDEGSMTDLVDLAANSLEGVLGRDDQMGGVDYKTVMNIYFPFLYSYPYKVPGMVSDEQNTNAGMVGGFRRSMVILATVGVTFSQIEGSEKIMDTDEFSRKLRHTIGGFGPLATTMLDGASGQIARSQSVMMFKEAAYNYYPDLYLADQVANIFSDRAADFYHGG